jgi:hypothetical protein
VRKVNGPDRKEFEAKAQIESDEVNIQDKLTAKDK